MIFLNFDIFVLNRWDNVSFVASYLCTNYVCKKDASHKENVDWGYYNNAIGTKLECQAKCLSIQDCEVHEWSDADRTCKWWKKGGCQYEKDNTSADPKFVSCKKLGTLYID